MHPVDLACLFRVSQVRFSRFQGRTMKLGLLTDIHEHVGLLRAALDDLHARRVDQIVVIGDVFANGSQLDETCRLLAAARAIGVFGNHDYALIRQTDADHRRQFAPETLAFLSSLQPRLDLAGCHFAHVEPWLNPEELAEIWYFDGPPDSPQKHERIFRSHPAQWLFAGHYHRWLILRPSGPVSFTSDPLSLHDDRYFVVVGALCLGWFATFDTDTGLLTPLQVAVA